MSEEIDWERLRAAAVDVAGRAHAPYSKLGVGAAALATDGRVITGCNVENASYGLTLCAECGVVTSLHASGGEAITAISVTNAVGDLLTPCGRCRQLLLEAGGPDLLIDGSPRPVPISELLPNAFGPERLP